MTQATTITVKLDGVPLEGVEVVSSGEMDEIFITDAGGKITKELPTDYASCVLIAVRYSTATYIAVCLLESGENYEIDIPAFEGETETRGRFGLHAPFARKL